MAADYGQVGPVCRMRSRETVVDLLVQKFTEGVQAVQDAGVQAEPAEVINAMLQYVSKAMKYCVRNATSHEVRMLNQSAFSQAFDTAKLIMLDESDREQVM